MDKCEMADNKKGPEETKTQEESSTTGRGEGSIFSEGEENDNERKTKSSCEVQEESSQGKIQLTKIAAQKIREITVAEKLEDSRLRVKVVGGGCAGFSYDMAFDEKTVEEEGRKKKVFAKSDDPVSKMDIKLVLEGITIIVDQMSMMYLVDTEIDYVEGLQGAGFKFKNPNVKNTCGCGSSFQ